MIKTSGLNHLALPAKDPRRSAQFYTDLFNMRIIDASPQVVFLQTVGSRDLIALNRSDAKIESRRETMHFGFIVEPEDFDEAVRTIEEKSIKKISNRASAISGDTSSLKTWTGTW